MRRYSPSSVIGAILMIIVFGSALLYVVADLVALISTIIWKP